MQTLRQQMAGSAKRAQATTTTTDAGRLQGGGARPSVASLRVRVEERLRALPDGDTPERRRQARRLFLEAVLTWEFGEQLLLDTNLTHLFDQLQATLDDTDMGRELDGVLDGLLASR